MVRTFHYCDRCGALISEKKQDVVFRGRRNEDDSMEVCDIIELCSDCKEKLFNWLITPDEDADVTEEATVEEPEEESNRNPDERIDILELPGIGKRSIEHIKKALEERGLSLREER